jgi:signal transduction histidine kinase
LDNAVKYLGEPADPVVTVGCRQDRGQTVCYVQDNGLGIDASYHDKVFGLFEQLDPRTEGTGVGLALVKRIIEFHGGRVWVESAGHGQGSTFCFTLPPASVAL